jgi:hypothetical protein
VTPEGLMANACPRIRDLGWAFFFAPETIARADELGLDGLRFYFLGRGGVLGDVDATVVGSAFGYFEPSFLEKMWDTAREVVAPRDAARAYLRCAAEFGRSRFAAVDGLDAYCAAADLVNQTADPTGLSLYAAWRAEPLADDPPARAMQLTFLLRELRGSAHLVAVRASGLDALTAHCVKRPEDLPMLGWSTEAAPDVSEDDRTRWAAAERLTDDMLLPAYAAPDEAGRQALVTGLDRIEAVLAS